MINKRNKRSSKIIPRKVATHQHYRCKSYDEIWKIKELIHKNIWTSLKYSLS